MHDTRRSAAAARADELGELLYQCWGRHGLAYDHLRHDEWAQAAELYDQCAALYGPTDNRLAQLLPGPHPALARLGLGRVDEAAQLIAARIDKSRSKPARHRFGGSHQ